MIVRCYLALLMSLSALSPLFAQAQPAKAANRPISGEAVERFAAFDAVVQEHMDRIGATSTTLAIARDGELLYSRGFGWKDLAKKMPTPPDAVFRLGSITKPLTAVAIRQAVNQGLCKVDDPVLPWLQRTWPNAKPADDRVKTITMEQVLTHKGGWDLKATDYDPMFWPNHAARDLKLNRPVTPGDMALWGLSRKLDFAPGERESYSNYGYCVLGRVLEAITKKSYFEAIQELVLKPNDLKDFKLGHSTRRDPREVAYVIAKEHAFNFDVLDSHGGLIASAPAVAAFAELFHVTGYPRQKNDKGYGIFFGSLPGCTTMMRQHPSGWNVIVLSNARREQHLLSDQVRLREAVDALIEGLK